jgi:hypothetical protein
MKTANGPMTTGTKVVRAPVVTDASGVIPGLVVISDANIVVLMEMTNDF